MNANAITIDFAMPIIFGNGWSCCIGKESHVVVFDNGARWAVCKGCSKQYAGPVFSLAIFDPETFVFSYKYLDTLEVRKWQLEEMDHSDLNTVD